MVCTKVTIFLKLLGGQCNKNFQIKKEQIITSNEKEINNH